MEQVELEILKFLSTQNGFVNADKFPAVIKAEFSYGIKSDSLIYKLNELKRKGFVSGQRDVFKIEDDGLKGLQAEELRISGGEYKEELQFVKLQSEVIDLRNRIGDFEAARRRANIALIISVVTVIVLLLQTLKWIR